MYIAVIQTFSIPTRNVFIYKNNYISPRSRVYRRHAAVHSQLSLARLLDKHHIAGLHWYLYTIQSSSFIHWLGWEGDYSPSNIKFSDFSRQLPHRVFPIAGPMVWNSLPREVI